MRKQLASGVEIRNASSDADYAAIVELQRQTWGERFADAVPPAILMISRKMGGVVAGAFDEAGRLLGFIYGLSGFRHGRRAHWSHMLAVTREAAASGWAASSRRSSASSCCRWASRRCTGPTTPWSPATRT